MTAAGRTRSALERRLRRAWIRRPSAPLRAAGALFGLAAAVRAFAYDAGLAAVRRAPIPVVSVGGLTVGGSGKTPLAAAVAAWLAEAGRRPAVVTPGFADEMSVHAVLVPDALVLGGRDRLAAVRLAAERGARTAVLDDGFQHRKLARDLDLVLVDVDAVARTNGRPLPAGPFREGFRALGRAEALVCVRRGPYAELAADLAGRLARSASRPSVARCWLRPGELVPANRAAAAVTEPDPALAVAGIMKPRLFLEGLRRAWPGVEGVRTFPDHRRPGARALAELLAEAGSRGVVCTLKDAAALAPRVAERAPLWYLADTLEWESGETRIRRAVLEATAG